MLSFVAKYWLGFRSNIGHLLRPHQVGYLLQLLFFKHRTISFENSPSIRTRKILGPKTKEKETLKLKINRTIEAQCP